MPSSSPLVKLLKENKTKKLRPYSSGRGGFLDARGRGKAQILCGVYSFLHKKCATFPSLTRKQFQARRSRKPAAVARKKKLHTKASSKRTGKYFHRQVYHSLICKLADRCTCPEGETKALVRKQSAAYEMVKAATLFIEDSNMVAMAGEIIITDPKVGLGTRFDMICERLSGSKKGGLVLVSWKTTCDCPFAPNVKRVSLASRVCREPSDDTSSEDISAREHLAQLVLELHMLRDEHSIDVKEACIVYLSPFLKTYRTVYVDDVTRDYLSAWKWILNRKK